MRYFSARDTTNKVVTCTTRVWMDLSSHQLMPEYMWCLTSNSGLMSTDTALIPQRTWQAHFTCIYAWFLFPVILLWWAGAAEGQTAFSERRPVLMPLLYGVEVLPLFKIYELRDTTRKRHLSYNERSISKSIIIST